MFDLSSILCDSGARSLEFQPEVGSTNDWAIELAADITRELPLLVLTERQTGGRGRGTNRWWSAEGALTFSLVVNAEELAQNNWPLIALATGLAICEQLSQLCPEIDFTLKWPNDVYARGRKISGVLVESPSSVKGRVIIGVGLNVNNSFANALTDISARATALCDEAGASFDLGETLCEICQAIIREVTNLSHGSDGLANRFRCYCHLSGRVVEVQAGRERYVGRCLGIDDEAHLLVQCGDSVKRILSGTIVAIES